MTPIALAARVALGLEPGFWVTIRGLLGGSVEIVIDRGLSRRRRAACLNPFVATQIAWLDALIAAVPVVPASAPPAPTKRRKYRMARTDKQIQHTGAH